MRNVRYWTDGQAIFCETDRNLPIKGVWEIDGWCALAVRDMRKADRPVEIETYQIRYIQEAA